jgi:hypothetical protein
MVKPLEQISAQENIPACSPTSVAWSSISGKYGRDKAEWLHGKAISALMQRMLDGPVWACTVKMHLILDRTTPLL